ncbi:MAG: hypothetical protein QXX79_07035 [Candidatus Bathyarchaeia archaeon]
MVEKVIEGNKELYKCQKCGHLYAEKEKAVICESAQLTPFKYQIGDVVQFRFKSHITLKELTFRGIVEERWVQGLSEKNGSAHKNMYKIKIIDEERGLIACKPEEEILRKVT